MRKTWNFKLGYRSYSYLELGLDTLIIRFSLLGSYFLNDIAEEHFRFVRFDENQLIIVLYNRICVSDYAQG